jgi:predicted amidophosphoribosyltransferase
VEALCPACWASLAQDVDGRREGDVVAAFFYRAAVVVAHRRLKFGGAVGLVGPLCRRWAAVARPEVARAAPDAAVALPPAPLRLPPRRLAARRLAKGLAARLGLPLGPRGSLMRVGGTRGQTGRPAPERRRLARDAFRASRRAVEGRAILLVDDVTTTGATIARARAALLEAGAACVLATTLGRTPPPR